MTHPTQADLHNAVFYPSPANASSAHAYACPDCAAQMRGYRAADSLLKKIARISAPADITAKVLSSLRLLKMVKPKEAPLAKAILRLFWWGTWLAVSFGAAALVLQAAVALPAEAGNAGKQFYVRQFVAVVNSSSTQQAALLCSVLLLLVSCYVLYDKYRQARAS